MSRRAPEPEPRRPTGPSPLPACRVLIAEDDDVLRKQLYDYLSARGATCYLAKDGARALELAGEQHPDVAVVDMNLPDMTGIEVAARVGAQCRPPKLILMSGYDDTYRAARRAQLGAASVIEKPVPLRVVAQQVQRALST